MYATGIKVLHLHTLALLGWWDVPIGPWTIEIVRTHILGFIPSVYSLPVYRDSVGFAYVIPPYNRLGSIFLDSRFTPATDQLPYIRMVVNLAAGVVCIDRKTGRQVRGVLE